MQIVLNTRRGRVVLDFGRLRVLRRLSALEGRVERFEERAAQLEKRAVLLEEEVRLYRERDESKVSSRIGHAEGETAESLHVRGTDKLSVEPAAGVTSAQVMVEWMEGEDAWRAIAAQRKGGGD